MARTSQRKGRAGELELCRVLSGFGYDVKPGAAVSFGSTPDAVGLPGIHIEVKRREQMDIASALKQAEVDAQRFGGVPCVFYRRSREPWRVVVPLTAWIEMFKAWSGDHERSESDTLRPDVL